MIGCMFVKAARLCFPVLMAWTSGVPCGPRAGFSFLAACVPAAYWYRDFRNPQYIFQLERGKMSGDKEELRIEEGAARHSNLATETSDSEIFSDLDIGSSETGC
jgi:hypothetical protein